MTDDIRKKKPKFKYTKELVTIALEEMTQDEIRKLCRVAQSVVSKWKSGEARAFVDQVAPLLKLYGSRLNRTTSRVYLVRGKPIADAKWQDSERGQRLLALEKVGGREVAESEQPDQRVRADHELRALTREITGEDDGFQLRYLIEIDKEEFAQSLRPVKVVHVDGPIVLRYAFCEPDFVERGKLVERIRVTAERWLVHEQQRDRFFLVRQARRFLYGLAKHHWHATLAKAWEMSSPRHAHVGMGSAPEDRRLWVESADDAGRWISGLEGPFTADGLITFTDEYVRNPKKGHGAHDELVLPFLVRKMLIEHGYAVPDVERITGFE